MGLDESRLSPSTEHERLEQARRSEPWNAGDPSWAHASGPPFAYYGDDFRVECPTGSGRMMTLFEVARDITQRLEMLFRRRADGRRPPRLRRRGEVPDRPAVARQLAVLRELPRRHRHG